MRFTKNCFGDINAWCEGWFLEFHLEFEFTRPLHPPPLHPLPHICNGCSPTYDEESFTPPGSFQRPQICPDIVFFAIRFCNCISAIFLPLHYNFSSQLTANLSFFKIKLDWVYYRSQNTQSLLCIAVHSDIWTNRRQRYMSKTCFAKLFKLKLK